MDRDYRDNDYREKKGKGKSRNRKQLPPIGPGGEGVTSPWQQEKDNVSPRERRDSDHKDRNGSHRDYRERDHREKDYRDRDYKDRDHRDNMISPRLDNDGRVSPRFDRRGGARSPRLERREGGGGGPVKSPRRPEEGGLLNQRNVKASSRDPKSAIAFEEFRTLSIGSPIPNSNLESEAPEYIERQKRSKSRRARQDKSGTFPSIMIQKCEENEESSPQTSPRDESDNESPRSVKSSPRSGGSSPRSGGSTPRSETITPRSGGNTPRSGGNTPRSGGNTPRSIGSTPRSGGNTPRGRDGPHPPPSPSRTRPAHIDATLSAMPPGGKLGRTQSGSLLLSPTTPPLQRKCGNKRYIVYNKEDGQTSPTQSVSSFQEPGHTHLPPAADERHSLPTSPRSEGELSPNPSPRWRGRSPSPSNRLSSSQGSHRTESPPTSPYQPRKTPIRLQPLGKTP